MRRTALALVAILIALSALAACGDSGPTKADYKKQFDPINQQIKDLGSAVGDAVVNAKARTDSELAAQFAGLSTQTRTQADELTELETPDEAIQTNQNALTSALRDAARDLRSIAAAASAGNGSAAKAATVKLGSVTSPQIKKAREAIEKQLAET